MNTYYKNLLSLRSPDFNFTSEQINFLKSNNDDIILRAIPGSGKTTLLAYKVKQLILENPSISKIQCISYTNVTVNDLEKKCEEALTDEQFKKVEFSTFHSFCLEHIIKPFGHLYYYNGSRIYQELFNWEAYGSKLIESLASIPCANGCKYEDIKYIKNNDLKCSDCKSKRNYIFDLEKNQKKIDYNIYVDENCLFDVKRTKKQFVISKPEKRREVYLSTYFSFLRQNNLIDFNLLLYFSLRLVHENTFVREVINSSFDYICIDEFQDISDLQYKIINLLINSKATKDTNPHWIFIGDPNQSIYGFAGAKMDCMYQMRSLIGSTKEIQLKKSFRCSKKVFEGARNIYNSNLDKFIKSLSDYKSEDFLNFLEYLKVDPEVESNHDNGSIKYVPEAALLDGVCFIGTDRFDSLETYNKYKPFDNEYSHFENLLENYKTKFGYKYINLFTHYLIVKYNFTNSIGEFQSSLSDYIYSFEKLISEELLIEKRLLKKNDYCLSLDDTLDDDVDLFSEYCKFHKRIDSYLEIQGATTINRVKDWSVKLNHDVAYDAKINFGQFIEYLRKLKKNVSSIEIKYLHKIKGLQYEEVILKTDKIPYRTSKKDNQTECAGDWIDLLLNKDDQCQKLDEDQIFQCIEELNKIYVMITRSKSNVSIISDKSVFLPDVF